MDKEISKQLDKLFEGSTVFQIVNATTGEKRTYHIVSLSAEDARQGQWVYSKTYNKALTEGIFTADEMLDILKRRNIIGDDFDKQVSDFQMEIQEKLVEMELASSREEKKIVATEISDLRNKLFRLNYRFQGPMDNTAEHLASQARLDFYTSAVVYDSKGNRVWNSIEEYWKESDKELAFKSRFEVSMWIEGLDPDILSKLPETLALQEIAEEEEKERLEDLKQAEEESIEVETTEDSKQEVSVSFESEADEPKPPPVPIVPEEGSGTPKKRRRRKNSQE